MAGYLPKQVNEVVFSGRTGNEDENQVKSESSVHQILDGHHWTGSWCILKAINELKSRDPGQILEVRCSDPAMKNEQHRTINPDRARILKVEDEDGFLRIFIRCEQS